MFKPIIIISMMSLLWWRHNTIMMLISLELFILSCFISTTIHSDNFSSFIILFFLAMMVSGSTMGLSLLVSISRIKSSSSRVINTLTFA